MNTITKSRLLLLAGAVSLSVSAWLIRHEPPAPPRQALLKTAHFGDIAVAEPNKPAKGLTLLFADTRQVIPQELALRVAAKGGTVAVVDSRQALRALSTSEQQCLDTRLLTEPLQTLGHWIDASTQEKQIIAGMGNDGALLAFLAAQTPMTVDTDYLSIDFSSKLPDNIKVCPPFTLDEQTHTLKPFSDKLSFKRWRAVWTDQPSNETAIFVRSIPGAETVIAPYDTPLETVAVDEIGNLLGQTDKPRPPMPIVEVFSAQPHPTLTLFYSGDGGWRDLDRAVAQEMAASGFSVAGVDVLRYFWERKSPEQAARDLSATLAYYRKKLGTRSFVLTGYSFGADILPALFNRLSPADQDAVKLLVLLAPGEQANFEIHVSGWLGNQGGEMPLAPELARIPAAKIMCVFGEEEKDHQGCKDLKDSSAELLELPGGHHFDQDYPKLARRILDTYRRHAIE